MSERAMVGEQTGGRSSSAVRLARARRASGTEFDAEQVFERLRAGVFDHRLPPGMQLKEQPLADAFGVSRAVIRQALARLESCSLVTHKPNRGVFVAAPSVAEGRDIFAARRYIEAAIIDTLVGRMRRDSLTGLGELVAREQAAYRSGELRKALRLSIGFHRELARRAGNGVLAAFLEELLARTPLVMLSYQGTGSPACAQSEHEDILDAIRQGDASRAKVLMTEHIDHLEQRLTPGFGETAGKADIATLLELD